ncbi:MAG: pkn1 2 [Myxococcaceae bacterium]|nr:pkn1 2 [Myxococcaceae bacterium]
MSGTREHGQHGDEGDDEEEVFDEDARFAKLLAAVGRASPVPLSALRREPELRPGERLLEGRFTLGAKLGQGGMGVVYEAYDEERGGPVALKFLGRIDAASIVRFKLEFRSLADVVHPHLSRMDALFRFRGSWFFSMELLEGQNFLEHYRSLSSVDARLGFLRSALPQLEAGISALHRLGKLHCDLKPSNVFVSPTGHVTIVDFGLVVDPALDDVRHAHGTPGYLAPELRKGVAPSPASDWYAVGVMLYQALSGELPKPHMPALAAGMVPADLWAICSSLLHSQSAARQHGVALLRQLGTRPDEPREMPQVGCVGRRHELAFLGQALARARTGSRVLCRVSGPSGMGKTTLLRAFLQGLAASDALVLHGRCFEREFTPFKLLDGVVDALADELASCDLTLPSGAQALARAFASVARLALGTPAELERLPSDEEQRRQLGDALCQALQHARKRRVLVIAIDDAHWADADGAALCASIMQSVPSLLLVLVHRDGPPLSCLEPLAHAARVHGLDRVDLALGPLAAEEMRELLQQLPATAHAAPDDILREAQGSPYLARELMQYAQRRAADERTLPPTLEQALQARMAELPPHATTLLQLVALSGAPLEAHVLARAAGAPDTERTIALLRAHSLLRSHADDGQPGGTDVYHDRVRSLVVEALTPEDRRALHARLGDALALARPQEPERIALHLQGAGQLERAAGYAWQAGRRAAFALAFEQAAHWLALAHAQKRWSASDEVQLARERGEALALLGQNGEAGAVYLHAAALSAEPARQTLLLLAAGQLLCAGQLQHGFEILRENLSGPQGGLPTAFELPQAIARMFTELTRLLQAPLRTQPGSDAEQAAQVDACHWATLGLAGSDSEGTGLYLLLRQAVEALHFGDPLRIVRALELTAALASCTQAQGLTLWIAQMEAFAARIAEPLSDPRIAFWRAFRLACQAYWSFDQAAAHRHVAVAQALASECHGVQRESVLLWFCCGYRDFEAGRTDAHFTQAAEVQRAAEQRGDLHAQMWSELIDLRPVLAGELEQRWDLLQAVPARHAGALVGLPRYVLEWQLAATERAAGRLTEAHARSKALLASARDSAVWSIPRNRSQLLSEAIACCLACAAETEDVEPWLLQAEALLEEHAAPSSWLLPYRAAAAWLRRDPVTTRLVLAQCCALTGIEHEFWVTRSAQLLLSALDAEREAEQRAECALTDAGVKKPRQFAQVVFPGMASLLSTSRLHKPGEATPSL